MHSLAIPSHFAIEETFYTRVFELVTLVILHPVMVVTEIIGETKQRLLLGAGVVNLTSALF